MSNSEEAFRVIKEIQVEIIRLKQVESNFKKLQEEYEALRKQVEKMHSLRVEPFIFNVFGDQSINYIASSLDEFEHVLKVVPIETLEYHFNRGDFESWLKFIGLEDMELVFSSIRKENLFGEALRKRILDAF